MAEMMRAPRNRTVTLDDADRVKLRSRLTPPSEVGPGTIDATVLGDCHEVAGSLAPRSVDLLFLDPPHNLNGSVAQIR